MKSIGKGRVIISGKCNYNIILFNDFIPSAFIGNKYIKVFERYVIGYE